MKTQKSVGTKGTAEVAAGVVRVQILIPECVRDLGNAPARAANERQAVLKNSIWTELRQLTAPLSSVDRRFSEQINRERNVEFRLP